MADNLTPPTKAASPQAPSIPAFSMLLLYGTAYGLAGPVVSRFLMGGSAIGALSVLLAALGLVRTTEALFVRHRARCWDPADDPQAASTELVAGLVSIMTGVMIAFAIFAVRLNDATLKELFSFQFDGVFVHRIVLIKDFSSQFAFALKSGVVVMGFCFLLTAIYMESGLALAIAWIGSLWGIGLVSLVRDGAHMPPVIIAILLSLAANSVGFLTAGTTGLFLSRGALKYGISSPAMKRIMSTSLMLFAASLGFILFAAAIHAWVGAKA
jgi:hypothetical protein